MRTITRHSDADRLFKHGRRTSHQLVSVLSAPSPEGREPGGRVMFVAGRKMGDAVMRNRCKRVLREACRRAGGPWPGLDVALIARPGVATAPFKDVDSALASCLRRAGMATP